MIVGTPAPVSKPTIAKIGSGHLKITFRRLNGGRLNGGSLVNPAYVAVCASSNGGVPHQGTATKKQSRIDIKHLTVGKKYTCTVKAQNTRGVSLPSLPSNQTKA